MNATHRSLWAVTVIFGLVCFGAVASAQEREADSAVCSAADTFNNWRAPHANSSHLKRNVETIGSRLAAACTTQPDFSDSDGSRAWVGWLVQVDHIIEEIDMSVADRFSQPISASERPAIALLLTTSARLQRNAEAWRAAAYTAERVRVREVIREVPVACPELHDPCTDTLRAAAGRWASRLRDWTDRYRGSGDDWQLAKQSVEELAALSRGNGDPVPYVVGWLAQWRSVRRHGSESFLGSGPMLSIAADMRAQLGVCGMVQHGRGY